MDWQNVVSGTSGFKTCKPTLSDAAQNWHTYTFTWAPGSLTWGIDGQTTCSQHQVVPTNPMFLIINNALGGSGGQINGSDFPQTMQIDYVRASAANASATGTTGATSVPGSPGSTAANTGDGSSSSTAATGGAAGGGSGAIGGGQN